MSVKPKIVNFDWLSKTQRRGAALHLAKNHELPDYLTYYSKYAISSFVNTINSRMFNSEENISMATDYQLVIDEAEIIRHRFRYASSINLFEIAESYQDASMAFAIEFLEEGTLKSFTSITPRPEMSKLSLLKVSDYCKAAGLELPILKEYNIECEWKSFEHEVMTTLDLIHQDTKDSGINIFLLLDSRLGNSPDPIALLRNIYNSMPESSYLIIVQSLNRNLNENTVVLDYSNLLSRPDSFMGNKEFANALNDDGNLQVKWDDSDGFAGTIATIKAKQDMIVEGVDIESGTDINIFTTKRFSLSQMTTILESLRFKIIDISLDEKQSGSLFLVKK